jgi:hypothetical protein
VHTSQIKGNYLFLCISHPSAWTILDIRNQASVTFVFHASRPEHILDIQM